MKHLWDDFWFEVHCARMDGQRAPMAVLMTLYYGLANTIAAAWCIWVGHDMEDLSYANEGTGVDHLICKRCQFEVYHVHY